MPLTLQQIRDYVRTSLDIEQDDLPDSLLDAYVREGSKRIERAEARWPFYEAIYSWAFGPIEAPHLYSKTLISSELDQIANVNMPDHGPLTWIGIDAYQELQSQQPSTTGRPVYYTEWQESILVHPQPDTSYTVNVRGYRTANDWVADGAGATPDMPDELHNTVALWALSKAYAQQEDPEMAALYERQFSDELNEMRRRLVIVPHQQPLVLNSGALRQGQLLARPRFDWEVS